MAGSLDVATNVLAVRLAGDSQFSTLEPVSHEIVMRGGRRRGGPAVLSWLPEPAPAAALACDSARITLASDPDDFVAELPGIGHGHGHIIQAYRSKPDQLSRPHAADRVLAAAVSSNAEVFVTDNLARALRAHGLA